MSRSQKTFVPIWALLLALCPTPKLLANSLSSVLAQSPSFTLPESLPKGTTVRVNGSSSMIKVNEVLKQRYEEKFSNTQVELAAGSSDDALEALQQGDVDIAAVGRSLTETEKAAGLVAVPIDRAKIAIIIGPNNSFDGNLTFEQFARIFRGEITDWSEIGGEPGPIRLVDRPDFSDTRRALSGYEVFKTAPFETGSNADQVSQDNTSDVIQALGNDGISYAIADQVLEEDNVKIVSMHQTFPDDPRYPYSQIRTYVYNKEATNPANLAFLGFATSEPGQEVIVATPSSPSNGTETDPATTTATSPDGTETDPATTTATSPDGTETDPATITAIPPDAAASPEGTTDATTALIPESDVAATTTNRGLPWWLWLLGIPLLGGLLWWLLKGRGSEPTGITSIPPGTGTTVTPPATPEVAAGDTNISAVGTITTPDSPATSPITASPPSSPNGLNLGTAGLVGAGLAGLAGALAWSRRPLSSQITLSPEENQNVKAVWDIPEADISQAQQQGGQQFKLRVYDVTDIDIETEPPHNVQEHDCDESISELTVPVEQGDRNYLAEVGYMTEDQQWLPLCRSNAVYVPPSNLPEVETPEVPNVNLGLNTPSVDLPEVETPNVPNVNLGLNAPSVDLPEIETPEVPDVNLELSQASVDVPEIETPEIPDVNLGLDTPSVDLPEVETPEIPDVNLELSQASVDVPEIETPDVPNVNLGLDTPSVDLPEVETPEIPDVNLGLNTPSVDLPEVETPNVPNVNLGLNTPSVDLPEVETPEVPDVNLEGSQPSVDLPETPSSGINLPGLAALSGAALASLGAIPFFGSRQSRITLTPETDQNVKAVWNIPEADISQAQQQGGQQFKLRVYDVTDIDIETEPPHNVQEHDCDESISELTVPVEQGDRNYLAEVGYMTQDEQWLPLCRSNAVYVPPSNLPEVETPEVPNVNLGLNTPSVDLPEVETPNVPNVNLGLNAPSVDLPEVENPEIPDVNLGLDTPSVDIPEVETPEIPDVNLGLNAPSVDLPEVETPEIPDVNLGLDTPSVDVPEIETPEIPDVNLGLNTPSVDLPEVETPEVPDVNLEGSQPSVDLPETPSSGINLPGLAALSGAALASLGAIPFFGSRQSRITLTPETDQNVKAVWNIPEADISQAQQQGGQQFKLRVYDVTDIDIEVEPPHNVQEHDCDESISELTVPVEQGDRNYLAEVGYMTEDQQWLPLCRSNAVYVPPSSLPEVETPEVPNVNLGLDTPSVDIPEIETPEIPDVNLGLDTPSVDIPEIETPEIPDVNLGLNTPSVDLPEVETPEIPDVNLGLNTPSVDLPEVETPEIPDVNLGLNTPSVDLPEVETPEIPDVNLGLDTPSVDIPEIETPEIPDVNLGLDTPSVDLPEVETPEIPDVNLGLDTPSVDVPEIETPEIPDVNLGLNTPSVDLPEVETPDVPDVNLGLDTPSVDLPEVETPDVPDVNLELSQPETDIADTEAPETEDEDTPSGDMNLPGIALGGLAVASIGAIPLVGSEQSRLSVTPTDNQTLSATWEIPQGDIDAVKQQGGQQLQLRVYDVTDTDSDAHTQTPQNVQQYDCDESTQDLEVSIEQGDRTYAAAIGYITDDDQWLPLCCSDSVYVPPSDLSTTEDSTVTEIGSDFTSSPTDVGDGDEVDPEVEEPAIAEEEAEEELDSTPTDSTEIEDSETESEDISDDIVNSPEITVDNAPVVSVVSSPLSQLTLTPTIDQGLEASWEIPQADIDAVKEQGGQRLQLRVYDVTDMNEASQNPESMQQYDCGESIKSLRLSLPQGDCTYAAAIGYVTHDDQWLPLCRSNIIFVPASQPVTTEVITAEPTIAANPILQHDCEIQHLTVNSRSHCFLFHPEQMQALKETALSKILEPGIHIIQIKSGTFGYGSADATREPIVLLLIDGGKVINKKTNVPVELTWSSLNGYHETLTLEVLETSTLSAFFFDINPDDNYGYLTLSIIQPYG